MIVEFGNHACRLPGIDERPKVTTVVVPEFDEPFRAKFDHYGHKPGLSVSEFKTHRQDALDYNGGITRLPDHEALLAIVSAWPEHGTGRPAWVRVSDHTAGLTPEGRSTDLERFLSEFYECPTLSDFYGCDDETAQVKKELEHWTRAGAPGEFYSTGLPDITALYTDDGRAMNNNNDGGDALQALMMGTGSAAGSTTLTTSNTLVTNATTSHRVYVYTTSGNAFVWGNCVSNTNASNASVITVDRWYVPLTPGGTAGSNPGTPWAWVLVDGGMVSTWFAGLATGANAPAHGDHTLSTNGNAEITTSGGGLIRKICPTGSTSGVASRTVTLIPVFTANGTDTLPATVTTVGFFASIVSGFGGAGGPMKFETALTPASATLSANGDQLTVTETITGS